MPYTDLRAFIDRLRSENDLAEITTEVDPRFEVSAYIRKTSDAEGPAVLMKRVKGYSTPILGGVFAARRRGLWAYDAGEGDAISKYLHALHNPLRPTLVEEGPCQQIVLLGDSADMTKFPNPIYSEKDAGHYVTMGVTTTKDPETGVRNEGIYRLQVKGKDKLGIYSSISQHVMVHLAKAESQGKPLPVAIALGTDPSILLAAAAKVPYGVDEYELAGGLRGSPVELVKCRTVDLEVPASSEIIIEGRIPPKVREEEGPFGEVTGYYGDAGPRPVIEITAITHREQPIYLAGLTGMPTTDNHILKGISYDASAFEELRRTFPEVRGVHFHPAGGVRSIMFVSLHQRYNGQAKAVIAAALGLSFRPKLMVVVDSDVNVYSVNEVLWAIATRSQPKEDIVVVDGLPPFSLDPSADEEGISSSMGIDATRPFGRAFPEVVSVPGVDSLPNLGDLRRNP